MTMVGGGIYGLLFGETGKNEWRPFTCYPRGNLYLVKPTYGQVLERGVLHVLKLACHCLRQVRG